MPSKLRWRIADLADRWLPRQCWADLVSWVLNPEDARLTDRTRLPWRPDTRCHEDAARVGYCYCNKITRGGS